jgi:hypothetical protein
MLLCISMHGFAKRSVISLRNTRLKLVISLDIFIWCCWWKYRICNRLCTRTDSGGRRVYFVLWLEPSVVFYIMHSHNRSLRLSFKNDTGRVGAVVTFLILFEKLNCDVTVSAVQSATFWCLMYPWRCLNAWNRTIRSTSSLLDFM